MSDSPRTPSPNTLYDSEGVAALDVEVIRQEPFNAETPAHALIAAVTPSASVYVRTNFAVPELDGTHRIRVDGAVASPFMLEARVLREMPQQTLLVTTECAGNDRLTMRPLPTGEPWSFGAVSTAEWRGVLLRDVLERADVDSDVQEIVVTGADSGVRDDAHGDDASRPVTFARSLPAADAMSGDALLATSMNGTPLTAAHGAPVRLVVPGWYGMASVKWVSAITAVREPFVGYFQQHRYVYDERDGISPVTRMRVKSIITSPTDAARCGRDLTVRGWAWSGSGGITRVQIGADGGDTWQDAVIGTPASRYAWTPFEAVVHAPCAGRFSLRSRATDATGATQPDVISWNRLGYGNNAVRTIVIDVV